MASLEEYAKVIETDVLVLGGGIAGCLGAIQAKSLAVEVVLVDKGWVGKTGASSFASGSFGVLNPEWGHDFDSRMNSAVRAGEYVNDRKWTEVVLRDSYQVFRDLVSYGVPFVKDKDGNFYRGKSFTGESLNFRSREIMPALRKQVIKSGAKIFDRIMITTLLEQEGRVIGAVGFDRISGDSYAFISKATIVAMGKASFKLATFSQTTPGSGPAIGYRAGAELISMETGGKRISWCADCDTLEFMVLNWGGADVNQKGERLGDKYPSESKLLSPHRSMALLCEVDMGHGPIYFDFDSLSPEEKELQASGYFEETTASAAKVVERSGVKPEGKVEIIKIYAGAEGGLRVNTKCETTVPGLYAAGDAAGTNYCGNGSYPGLGHLTCSAVAGKRAGSFATEYALGQKKPVVDEEEVVRLKEGMYSALHREGGFRPRYVMQRLDNVMNPYDVLLFQHDRSMQAALLMVEEFRDHFIPRMWAEDIHQLVIAHEVQHLVLCSEMILRSALFRTESRGTTMRASHLYRDDENWLAWVVLKEDKGKMKVWKEPIPEEYKPDNLMSYEERYSFKYQAD